MNSHLFTRKLPTKKLNARGNEEIRPANGSLSYDADQLMHQYAEGDSSYAYGTAGEYLHGKSAPRRAVADDGGMRFSEVADSGGTKKISIKPHMKNAVALLGSHCEPVGSFTYSEDTMKQLARFFGSKDVTNKCDELVKLRSMGTRISNADRVKKMNLERELQKMKTRLTQIVRSEGA